MRTLSDPGDPRERIDALFEQALELEDDARAAFLDTVAHDDPALRAELDSLLGLAVAPAPQLDPQALVAGALWLAVAADSPNPEAIDDAVTLSGTQVGGWRLLRLLGSGGMGHVYLAERVGDFQQRGALKLIRAGVDSGEFLRRFAQERQILASLNHPGIARLLDGGRDAQGRPYLVMEYVEGEPLDRYCDSRQLDIEQRLALFIRIGAAVAHAHRHLIVHRDLKPANIVVTPGGEVKLLDFGIAKVLADAEAPLSPLTHTMAQMFTPAYAAPEQIRSQPVATTTDVYQLGLLLYELLTGQRAQAITDTSAVALERAICEIEPPRPSQRVGDDRALATARHSTPAALRRKLRGDLDTIVLKALRKTPERRYASAAALVEDIERWQQGQPIRARPETFGYRAAKFMRRHPFGVATAATGLALLIAYAVTVTMQAGTIARERDRAQAEAAKARQVKALVLRLFEGADPEHSGGAQLSARELLDRGWTGIETELRGQPEVRIELLDTLGEAYRQLGQYDRAAQMFDQSLTAARALRPGQPLLLARALRSQGRLQDDQGNYDDALPLLREALTRYRQTLGELHAEVATTLSDLGMVQSHRNDFPAAERDYRDALAMRRRLFGEAHADTADSLNELGSVLRRKGDSAAAEPVLAQALALRRKLLPATHPQVARNLSDLALVRSHLGEYDSAEALYREALTLMVQARGAQHPQVATVMNNLAQLHFIRGNFPDAQALLRQALEIRRNALGERHPTVALNLNDLGRTLADSGDLAGAEALYRQALAAYAPDHPWRAATVFNLGRLAETRGDFRTAERHYREALAQQLQQYGANHDRVATDLYRLGIALHRQGRLDEAEADMRQALGIYRERLPAQHPQTADALVALGALLLDRRHANEALPLLREAARIRAKAFGASDVRTREAADLLARAERS